MADLIDFDEYIKIYKRRFYIGKAIKPEDWYLFQQIVKNYNVKSVLEFGCGLSTLLWLALDIKTVTFETDQEFMQKVAKLCNGRGDSMFIYWDNFSGFKLNKHNFDLAFVDGIDPRDNQIKLSVQSAPVVIVHDGWTRPTPNYVNEYLADWHEIKVKSLRTRLFITEGKLSQAQH